VADMNGDGRTDLVGIGWGGDAAWIWTQLSTSGLGPEAAQAVDYFGWISLALGDRRGDGRPPRALDGHQPPPTAGCFQAC
jgi:hypothetical protein